jgi:hypothetical protein
VWRQCLGTIQEDPDACFSWLTSGASRQGSFIFGGVWSRHLESGRVSP